MLPILVRLGTERVIPGQGPVFVPEDRRRARTSQRRKMEDSRSCRLIDRLGIGVEDLMVALAGKIWNSKRHE